MKKTLRFLALFLVLLGILTIISGCKKEVKIESVTLVSESVPASILTTEVETKLSEIKIKIVKSDDSEEIININSSMISDEDYVKLASEGTHKIVVKYEGFDVEVSLVIKALTVTPSGDTKDPINYSVNIKDEAGKPLSGFYVTFYLNNQEVAEGYTNGSGDFITSLEPNIYKVLIEGKDGYYLNQEMFETDLIGTQIQVEALFDLSSLEGKTVGIDHRYALGDLMYDFTLTNTDGEELNLYTLLTEYKAVVLNFWYTTCSACYYEFPYMVEAYESTYEINGKTRNYSDDICIIAVNPTIAGTGDDLSAVKSFKQSQNLSFDVALDIDGDSSNLTFDPYLTYLFGVSAYPTTVIIDSYGVIAEVGEGAVTATDKWTQTFDKYLVEDYYPVYTGGVSEDVIVKPDIEQEDSRVLEAAANGTNWDGTQFDGTYSPEDSENDKEYSWPWVVTEFNGKTAIKPSNTDVNSSFSIVYTTVTLKAGEVFTFDYYASTEDYDALYVTSNGVIVTTISGMSPDWETSYAYVALEEGEYEIGLVYLKDGSYASGEDAVFVTNVRVLQEEDIDKATYIFRECAYGGINEFTMSYNKYAPVVLNEEDGYYHVGSANGPLLLADLLSSTQWNTSDLYSISVEGKCVGADGNDYNKIIEEYSVYASNSTVGYTPVTEELANALKQIVKELGDELAANNLNQWLEVCVYYSAYATDGSELGLPIYGVCPWEPIMLEGDAVNDEAVAVAEFNRIILPRGYIFGYTPEVSGVYKFYSKEELETMCWFCDEDGTAIKGQEYGLRKFAEDAYNNTTVDSNFIMYVYLEAGQTYLFRAAFYDVSEYSEISVAIKYVASELDLLTIASPGYFTSSDDEMSDIISGNYVDVELNSEGYYVVKDSQANDTYLYADILYQNNITGYSLQVCLSEKFNAFDFSKDEFGNKIYDEEGYYRYSGYNADGDLVSFYVCTDESGEYYYVETVGEGDYTEANGYTYIKYTAEEIEQLGQADFTEYVKTYIAENMITDESSELYGCVKVDEKFAVVLGLLMDKYTFQDVDYSWVKLCYYYNHLGAAE